MGETMMYKGKLVELLAVTYVWGGEQYCTILMKNRLGRTQRQSVLLRRLTPASTVTAAPVDSAAPNLIVAQPQVNPDR